MGNSVSHDAEVKEGLVSKQKSLNNIFGKQRGNIFSGPFLISAVKTVMVFAK